MKSRWTRWRPERGVRAGSGRTGLRVAIGGAAALLVTAPVATMWWSSLLPDSYSVMEMGYADYGGGSRGPGHAGTSGESDQEVAGHETHAMASGTPHNGATSVTDLTGPQSGRPDAEATLIAREEAVRLADGRRVDGFTLDHTSPGPVIRVHQGDLVQVTLVNDSVAGGATLHWHGVDVPNAEDGVAGVTQDAVGVGERHVYRFVADDAGTYWYHSHQVSHEQVRGGLFGVLVVEPPAHRDVVDVVAAVHTYDTVPTVSGRPGESRVRAAPGDAVRVRVVNTDNAPLEVAVAGATYRVLAVDGRDLVGPGPVEGKAVQVAAGGRVDLGFVVPDASGVRVQLGADGRTALLFGPHGTAVPGPVTTERDLDLLSYGRSAPLGFDPDRADRRFEYSIGRRPAFLDGVPGLYWTINGHLFPDVPMFMVAEGDVVRMTLENHSGEVHPMHLHGHHAVVLSRDGVPASGSPWWVDSLDVDSGESYEVAFVADNPGIWMDHCHKLPHAADGLVAHLAYLGVSTPFRVGGESANAPE